MAAILKIALRDARFHAFHGVMEQERHIGNEFAVDLEVSLPLPATQTLKVSVSDDINSTISYAELFDCVKAHMKKPHALLEHLAASIIDDIAERWPNVTGIDIRVTKLAPPIPGSSCSACVSINWTR